MMIGYPKGKVELRIRMNVVEFSVWLRAKKTVFLPTYKGGSHVREEGFWTSHSQYDMNYYAYI